MDRREFCNRIALVTAMLGPQSADTVNSETITCTEPRRWELLPDDIIVLRYPGALSEKAHAHLQGEVERQFPGYKVLILEEGIELQVVHKAKPDGHS